MQTTMGRGERAGAVDDQSSPDGSGRAEAIEVARFIGEMTEELEAMAVGAKLHFLAYLLGMARAESNAVALRRVRD